MKRWTLALSILAGSLFLGAEGAAGLDARKALGSLQFRSGGVGVEERQAEPPSFQAKLVFASEKGEYFANVHAVFRKGKEERAVFSAGPWLWAKGEPGRYEVEARVGEASGRATLNLPRKGRVTVIIRLK